MSRDARLLFVGLLTEADDQGRLLGSPKRLAGAIFPHDEDVTGAHVTRWLEELERAEHIETYQVDGIGYVWLPGFLTHQRVSHPTPSRLPAPPSQATPDVLPNDSGEVPEALASDSAGSPEIFGPELGTGNREHEGAHEILVALPQTETGSQARRPQPDAALTKGEIDQTVDELMQGWLADYRATHGNGSPPMSFFGQLKSATRREVRAGADRDQLATALGVCARENRTALAHVLADVQSQLAVGATR